MLFRSISEQVNKEIFSAFLYLAMSDWCEQKGLKGSATWLYVQYQEEMTHGQNLYHYLHYRGESAKLFPVEKPESEFKNLLDIFEKVLAHEKTVTASIDNLATISMETRDHAAYNFLQWYVSEQVEEESNANDIIAKLKLAGNDLSGLLMIDTELGARTFAAPVVPGLPAGL